jgi:HEAT repeat protein
MKTTIRHTVLGAIAVSALLVAGSSAAEKNVHAGRASVYKNLDENSLENITTPQQIKNIDPNNVAPTEIWRRLEHGEKVECLSCIPVVSKLLTDGNAKTREISAWWLRRRIFGVFGPGQVYSQTLKNAQDQSLSEQKRAYANEALGEFLIGAGIPVLAKVATTDSSPMVRKAAVHGLWRINSQGPSGELGKAIGDADEGVRLEAIYAATRVNVFTDVAAVVARVSDESPLVRKRAAEALGKMKAKDAVVGLIALTSKSTEADASVRAAAVAALGRIGDQAAKDAVKAAQQDSNQFVRDAAQIALRQF